jgi:branched-chain amino acid transport system permease protein
MKKNFIKNFSDQFKYMPMLGWLIAAFFSVILELSIGYPLSFILLLPKIPVLFGFVMMLKVPFLIPSALIYVLIIYILPAFIVARFFSNSVNNLSAKLYKTPLWLCTLIHIVILYVILHLWAGISDYRTLVLKLMMIAIIVTLSINVINGYMGEFSCSHPGFMAVGAYVSSTITLILLTNDKLFGAAILPSYLSHFIFPIALVAGGAVAALSSLIVAIPSFRTRGDYLAIISLAFMFIIKSIIENVEIIGGPRGMGGQPACSTLPVVFMWTAACIWIINNFVRSILGKALNAVRDDETAAEAMTVNTKRTKIVTFMFAAFWAGVAGGLIAHVLRYVNPGSFGIQRLAEIFAMVYFGGLNSVVGSIAGAVGFNLLSEALRPLELFKWIIIPVLMILMMIYRPTGLIAFKEFDVAKLLKPKQQE